MYHVRTIFVGASSVDRIASHRIASSVLLACCSCSITFLPLSIARFTTHHSPLSVPHASFSVLPSPCTAHLWYVTVDTTPTAAHGSRLLRFGVQGSGLISVTITRYGYCCPSPIRSTTYDKCIYYLTDPRIRLLTVLALVTFLTSPAVIECCYCRSSLE